MKIVVIGGTGLIGSKTSAILRERSHEVITASPKNGINTITGEGLKQALAGAQVVVDLANSPSFENKKRASAASAWTNGSGARRHGPDPRLGLHQPGINRSTRGPCCWPPYMSPSSRSPWM